MFSLRSGMAKMECTRFVQSEACGRDVRGGGVYWMQPEKKDDTRAIRPMFDEHIIRRSRSGGGEQVIRGAWYDPACS